MSSGHYDYGRGGVVGIGTPQANPTVEAEMRVLLPPNVLPVTVRLTSREEKPLDRLRHYLNGLGSTLERYDTLRPDAFGFACTGSSYLTSREDAQALIDTLEARFGYPIVTAAAAIEWALRRIEARRIALVSPYPADLAAAAEAYWRAAEFDVVDIDRVQTGSTDTRSIYGLGSADARSAVDTLRELDVDAILLSGTGMPSLPLMMEPADGPPLLSSNLCLAMRLCELLGIAEPTAAEWGPRLVQATTTPDQGRQC